RQTRNPPRGVGGLCCAPRARGTPGSRLPDGGESALSPLQAVVLAIVQGLTEFLPVSSSAHLILVPRFLGWPDQGQVFDLSTHIGSVVAGLVYFRAELVRLVRAIPGLFTRAALQAGTDPALLLSLGVGTVPAAIAGLLFGDWVATRARDPHLIAYTTLFFG